jgi:hypothetical protein
VYYPGSGGYNWHNTFSGRLNTSSTSRFAVRYETDAGTWWDNNSGNDYWITPHVESGNYKPGIVGGGIALLSAEAELVTFGGGSTGWRIKGRMVVDRDVFPAGPSGAGVHIRNQAYGWENWDTFWHLNYLYTMTSGSNLMVYEFESDPVANQPAPPAPQVPMDSFLEYVIFAYYNIDATTAHVYWDNNFDGNYRTRKVDGAAIE